MEHIEQSRTGRHTGGAHRAELSRTPGKDQVIMFIRQAESPIKKV